MTDKAMMYLLMIFEGTPLGLFNTVPEAIAAANKITEKDIAKAVETTGGFADELTHGFRVVHFMGTAPIFHELVDADE